MKGGLTEATLREWKAKAKALDEALEWLDGRIDTEDLMTVSKILSDWSCDKTTKPRNHQL